MPIMILGSPDGGLGPRAHTWVEQWLADRAQPKTAADVLGPFPPNVSANNLRPIIGRHVYRDSRFQTDDLPIYTGIGWNFEHHGVVNHSAKEYVRGDDYTNTVEGFFSILKRGIYGIYQHVSEAHLHRYLCEYDFRYSHRVALGVDDTARMRLALAGIVGKRLTYQGTRRGRPASATA